MTRRLLNGVRYNRAGSGRVMKRHLLNLVTVLSLLLCVAVVVLWARSYFARDGCRFMHQGGRWEVVSSGGKLRVWNRPEIEEGSRLNQPALRRHIQALPALLEEAIRLAAERDRAMDRLAQNPERDDLVQEFEVARAAWVAQARRLDPPRPTPRPPLVSHSVHFAVPALVSALLPALWVVLRASGRRRLRECLTFRLCPQCGYDLCASPAQCPECGAGVAESFERAARVL